MNARGPGEPLAAFMDASGEEDAPQKVRGERAASLVSAAQSVQARASSFLAAALMITLGVSALTWYYAHALTRQTRARQGAQAGAVTRAQTEMPLPSLGRIDPPAPDLAPEPAAVASRPGEPGLAEAPVPGGAPGEGTAAPGAPPKSPGELALERRLSGAVFAREAQSAASPPGVPSGLSGAANADAAQAMGNARHGGERAEAAMAALLTPTATPAAQALRLPGAHFLLPKGAFIDCTLETAIDSTLPGMTTCITAADTFGADGMVVLLERGTKLVGETRGQVQQGQARVFVLWTQARTPAGVLVPLDSPGTDELGRSGLPGEVQRHFWERFGAGILISLLDGAVQAGVQAASHSGGTVVVTSSASQDVLTEVFKDTLRIPPTITKKNGERIQVLVARDIDFRAVYELHTAGR